MKRRQFDSSLTSRLLNNLLEEMKYPLLWICGVLFPCFHYLNHFVGSRPLLLDHEIYIWSTVRSDQNTSTCGLGMPFFISLYNLLGFSISRFSVIVASCSCTASAFTKQSHSKTRVHCLHPLFVSDWQSREVIKSCQEQGFYAWSYKLQEILYKYFLTDCLVIDHCNKPCPRQASW